MEVYKALHEEISEFCQPGHFMLCGGLRRGNIFVHDVDIVIVANDYLSISTVLSKYHNFKPQNTKYSMKIDDIPVEIYLADSEVQYEVLKLVRTGSNTFNLNLARQAHDGNMALRFDRKKKLYGLYGAIETRDPETRKVTWVINPYRHVAYREDEIIMKVFNKDEYLDPKNRNWGFEQEYDETI
jgi:DNA polymerase/3'-5' exonuclease PolX